MTINHDDDLDRLREIGRIVANTMQAMAQAMEPGMTTRELDGIGRELLEREGAVSAPQSAYDFPGATCTSSTQKSVLPPPAWATPASSSSDRRTPAGARSG